MHPCAVTVTPVPFYPPADLALLRAVEQGPAGPGFGSSLKDQGVTSVGRHRAAATQGRTTERLQRFQMLLRGPERVPLRIHGSQRPEWESCQDPEAGCRPGVPETGFKKTFLDSFIEKNK